MLISPESYYETNLKGKSAERIESVIRGLKNEIGHLKNVMEHPDYGSIMCPSESTRLQWAREYLEVAKASLTEAGGEYKPSQAELKAIEFDNNISAISKIVFSIGGFFEGHWIRTYTVYEDSIHTDIEHSLYLKPSNVGAIDAIEKEYFFDSLKRLHIGEWRRSYNTERFGYSVFDGTQWSLEVYFSNGTKPVKIQGSNAYPYNFNALLELLGIAAEQEVE